MKTKLNVGILLFDQAEVLDFAGPFEVFSVCSELHDFELYEVFTVSENGKTIEAVNGLSVNPKYSFDNCPKIDILIVPGGFGTRKLIDNDHSLQWIKSAYERSKLTLSICSAATLFGKLGLLNGKAYCTHNEVYGRMKKLVPDGLPQAEKRFTNTGKLYTSGGISAGIDLSFHILKKLSGGPAAKRTADYMEYRTI